MSEQEDDPDKKIIDLKKVREAGLKPEKPKPKRERKPRATTRYDNVGGGGDDPPGDIPPTLPHDCPVRCLGRDVLMYYFIDAQGHFIELSVEKIQRLQITALFKGQEYLVEKFPVFKKVKNPETGKWEWHKARHGWDHNAVANLLITTCQEMGTWNPSEKIRGCGCWREDDVLIFHSGNRLWLSSSEEEASVGLRGKLLYPASPKLPAPIRGAPPSELADQATNQWDAAHWRLVGGPGATLMERLVTWNFQRALIDPILIVGEITCGLLGGALDWRPMMCIKGDSRTGKSSLLDGMKAIFGPDAYISSGNATRAAIATKIGATTKPVILDEFERGENDKQQEGITQFMTLASSGETLDRSTAGHTTHSFQARSCFILSAINLPGLRPQDLNRLFVIELNPLEHPVQGNIGDAGDMHAVHKVWGSLDELTKIGRQLRGRLLDQWPRWKRTLNAYLIALSNQGHDRRQADQFGNALAAYDLVMHNAFSEKRVQQLTSYLPAAKTAETSDVESQGEQCLNYICEQTTATTRGGPQKTVLQWVKRVHDDNESEAKTVLAQHGMAVGQLDAFMEVDKKDIDGSWWVAIATGHSGTAKLVEGTSWYKKAGGTSGYVDVLKRLPGVLSRTPGGDRIRTTIGDKRTYVILLPYELLFD